MGKLDRKHKLILLLALSDLILIVLNLFFCENKLLEVGASVFLYVLLLFSTIISLREDKNIYKKLSDLCQFLALLLFLLRAYFENNFLFLFSLVIFAFSLILYDKGIKFGEK